MQIKPTSFEAQRSDAIIGTLTAFDRMILKGHLTSFFTEKAFQVFLAKQGVLLKDFGRYVENVTKGIKTHAQQIAAEAGRPHSNGFCGARFTYPQDAVVKH